MAFIYYVIWQCSASDNYSSICIIKKFIMFGIWCCCRRLRVLLDLTGFYRLELKSWITSYDKIPLDGKLLASLWLLWVFGQVFQCSFDQFGDRWWHWQMIALGLEAVLIGNINNANVFAFGRLVRELTGCGLQKVKT